MHVEATVFYWRHPEIQKQVELSAELGWYFSGKGEDLGNGVYYKTAYSFWKKLKCSALISH